MVISEKEIWTALEDVYDPEIPTISMVDLGVVSEVRIEADTVKVTLTPTFSGCPALRIMEDLVRDKLKSIGVEDMEVRTSFEKQWNTNMITEKGLQMLKKHGLATPPRTEGYVELTVLSNVECPFCGSRNTTMQSPFGPTLCRAIHYCNNCLQAFEQFKPLS
jgi:ring-1,2-phenylacetyl-CoA epoxidase subunit PaaD